VSAPLDIRRYQDGDAAEVRSLFIRVNRLMAPPHLAEAFEGYIARSLTEEIDIIDDETGKVISTVRADASTPRWFPERR